MRLDKYLSLCGFGTRSEVKQLIKTGLVTVDGIKRPANYHVDGEVHVDGELIVYEAYRYYMIHKPKGYITAKKDMSQPTVASLIEDEVSFVGRLDKDTEGLLLATNDGLLIHRLTNPKYKVEKTYYVELSKPFKDDDIKIVESGFKTKKTTFLPAKLSMITPTSINLTIIEGQHHQVKRMMAYFGLEVLYLKRISFGNLVLDPQLKLGDYRKLSVEEVNMLKMQVFE